MSSADPVEIWGRLLRGQQLTGLGLPMVEGRFDLRGLVAPEPSVLRQYVTPVAEVTQLSNVVSIRGVQWRGIDFSRSRLNSLLFHDCHIENCAFDDGHCRDWGMWGTTVVGSSFRSSDLRNAALGGISPRQTRNSFQRVDFSKADLRGTAWLSASMIDCTFNETKLSKVDFRGTVFKDCTFTGELSEVQFHRDLRGGESFPPNEMEGVDFRKAKLRSVEFRRLDMATVKWPEADDHIIVHDYPAQLDRVLAFLNSRSDVDAKAVAAVLSHDRKWLGAHQCSGVVNKKDIVEVARNEELASKVLAMFAEAAIKN